jgi:hypothetical protein
LLAFLDKMTRTNVRASYGEWAHQCFTDVDLSRFRREQRHLKLAECIKDTKEFVALVDAIRALHKPEREQLLARARKVARPTWAMIGRIDPAGQTVAGRTAELLISRAVVDLIEKMIAEPKSETGGSD